MSSEDSRGGFRPMPAAPAPVAPVAGPPPPQVRYAVILLLVNLALSVLVTVLSLVLKDEVIRTTLEHARSQGDTVTEETERTAIVASLWIRAGVNVLVGILYVFLISRLYRGRRWAWRRLVWLSVVGAVAMVFLLFQPYPVIFKVEQVIQCGVLVALAACVLHPAVRAHYAKRPPP
jgi:hypothetical protein